MNILVVGSSNRRDELKVKLKDAHKFIINMSSVDLNNADIIFDLNFDENPQNIQYYKNLQDKPVVVCAVKRSLAQMLQQPNDLKCKILGLNSLPTFINRNMAEVSLLDKENQSIFDIMFKKFEWPFNIIKDNVGMVAPRVVLMIINEAFYAFQEGTASKEDIDKGMKLGTNYPYGPFEWADRIGIKDVYETLDAIYEDSKDERYKICPLIKTVYLESTINLSYRA